MYGYMGDVLLSYGEEKCAYDNLGNPIVYRDNDIRWEKRRQVVAYGGVSFKYDGHGRRIEKNGISFTYDSNGKLLKQSNGLSFIYDNNGVVGLTYNGSTYFYRKDIQGNIIAILDSMGKVVIEYTYNAWGEHTIETLDESYDELSQLNPFRYRSYYYDSETGLYFLKTRYYDPETGRFISIDDISYVDPESINGLNLYAYCGNNPVMNVDPNGTFFLSILIATIAGAVISAGVSIVKQGVTNGWNNINWREVGASALLGGVMGGITAFGGALFLTPSLITAGGVLASIGGVVAVSFGAGVGAYAIRYAGKDQFNLGEMIIAGIDATFQGIANFMMGFAMGATGHYVDLQKGFKLLDVLPVSKTLSNSLLANTNSLFMNYILNHVIRGACKMLNGLVFGNLHKAFI